MKKVSIIGAGGTVGAATAYMLALNNQFEELCLIDLNTNLVKNHVMDLENAFNGQLQIYPGKYEDLKDSDIVIVTASIPNRNVSTRLAFLEGNIKVINDIGSQIQTYAPNAYIITATNPTDLLNYYLYKKFGFKREKLVGYNHNDSKRFEWALRNILSLNKNDEVVSPVIGEHGNSQVPLFSQVKVNDKKIKITEEQINKVYKEISQWFEDFNALGINRTTGWTSGVGLADVAIALSKDNPTLFFESAILNGEYGLQGLSLGVPVQLSNKGIEQVVEWELSTSERQQLLEASKSVKSIIEEQVLVNI